MQRDCLSTRRRAAARRRPQEEANVLEDNAANLIAALKGACEFLADRTRHSGIGAPAQPTSDVHCTSGNLEIPVFDASHRPGKKKKNKK